MNTTAQETIVVWNPQKAAEADMVMRSEQRKSQQIMMALQQYSGSGVIKETVELRQENGEPVQVLVKELTLDYDSRAESAYKDFQECGGADAVRAFYMSGVSYAGEIPSYTPPRTICARDTYV